MVILVCHSMAMMLIDHFQLISNVSLSGIIQKVCVYH